VLDLRRVVAVPSQFASICPQLLRMLTYAGERGRKMVMLCLGSFVFDGRSFTIWVLQALTAAVVIAELLAVDSTSVRSNLVCPLCVELMSYSEPSEPGESGVVVAEADVVACIERLHKVFSCCSPSPQALAALADVIPPLFRVFSVAIRAVSHVLSACEVGLHCAGEPLKLFCDGPPFGVAGNIGGVL
jgi:hypothetical protein